MYTYTETLDLGSFQEEFNRKYKPDKRFIKDSKVVLDKLSRLLTGVSEDLTRQFIADLSDYLELQMSNSQFVDELQLMEMPEKNAWNKRYIEGESRNHKKVKKNYAKTVEFKMIDKESKSTTSNHHYAYKKVAINEDELAISVKSEEEKEVEVSVNVEEPITGPIQNLMIFSSWQAPSNKRKQAVQLLNTIINNPNDWIAKMEEKYDTLVGDDDPRNYDFSTLQLTPEQLALMYGDLEPKRFKRQLPEKIRLNAKAKQNWVAVALHFTITNKCSDDVEEQRRYYENLRYVARKGDPLPNRFKESINTLMKHCKAIYHFYEELGDFVILTPELFEKLFFNQYPLKSRQRLIDKLKNLLPEDIVDFKRFP